MTLGKAVLIDDRNADGLKVSEKLSGLAMRMSNSPVSEARYMPPGGAGGGNGGGGDGGGGSEGGAGIVS